MIGSLWAESAECLAKPKSIRHFAEYNACVFAVIKRAESSDQGSDQMNAEVANIIARADIIPRLAPSSGPNDGDAIPDDIVGATVLGFGTISWDALYDLTSPIETAGLVVDYIPSGGGPARRAAFGFSELGMGLTYRGDIGVAKMRRPTLDC